jgi:hypothetical protein
MVSGILGNLSQAGYLSAGIPTDSESARLSNVQPYKYYRNENQGMGGSI